MDRSSLEATTKPLVTESATAANTTPLAPRRLPLAIRKNTIAAPFNLKRTAPAQPAEPNKIQKTVVAILGKPSCVRCICEHRTCDGAAQCSPCSNASQRCIYLLCGTKRCVAADCKLIHKAQCEQNRMPGEKRRNVLGQNITSKDVAESVVTQLLKAQVLAGATRDSQSLRLRQPSEESAAPASAIEADSAQMIKLESREGMLT